MGNGIMDMHMHSIYSDGSLSPKELVSMAKSLNIETIALTDHDNIDGAKEIVLYNDRDISIYSGVELSVSTNVGRKHILGYNIDLDNDDLNDALKQIKKQSLYNMYLYIEALKSDYGIILTDKEIQDIFKRVGDVGRPEIAKLLVKKGLVKDIDEAFDLYLRPILDRVRLNKKSISDYEGIGLITNAGGVAVWAHPVSMYQDYKMVYEESKKMKAYGLLGIEVQHIHTTDTDRAAYLEIARELGLVISGGTDFHGFDVKPDVLMGSGKNGNVHIKSNSLSMVLKYPNRYEQ